MPGLEPDTLIPTGLTLDRKRHLLVSRVRYARQPSGVMS